MNKKCWSNAIHKITSSIRTCQSPKPQSLYPKNVVDARMIKTGYDPNTTRANFQMEKLIKSGQLNEARHLFDEMPNRNMFTFHTLISGYVRSGDIVTARDLFDDMTLRDNVTWTILIGGYVKRNDPVEAFKLYSGMHQCGIMPDHVIFATLLSGFHDPKTVIQMVQVHAHVVKLGFSSAIKVCNTLIDRYCKCHCLNMGLRLFNEMRVRNNVSYNTMITGFVNDGMNREAVGLFLEMHKSGFVPCEFTFAAVLGAGVRIGNMFLVQQIHSFIMKTNFVWNVFVANALLDFYSKHDHVEDLETLFSEMPLVDGVSYNIVISCLARTAKYRRAFALFKELQQTGFDRRNFPFTTLLSMAADARNLNIGRQIHCQCIMALI